MKIRDMIAMATFVLLGPPLEAQAVNFAQDVRPIFERSCSGCHGSEKQKSGRGSMRDRIGRMNMQGNLRPISIGR